MAKINLLGIESYEIDNKDFWVTWIIEPQESPLQLGNYYICYNNSWAGTYEITKSTNNTATMYCPSADFTEQNVKSIRDLDWSYISDSYINVP